MKQPFAAFSFRLNSFSGVITYQNLPNANLIGKLTEDEAKPLFKQIVSAVQFLHSHNITHRDIKAENFLISKDSNGIVLKLSDFGLSAFMDQDKYFSTPCGSPCYAGKQIYRPAFFIQ